MSESSHEESGERTREMLRSTTNDYYTSQGNYQAGLVQVPPHYFTQHMFYPYVNPYSHLTESGGTLSIHGYGSDGRPKYRRSRTIFSPEQLEILEEHFTKYKYPDVKRRRAIAEELGLSDERVQVWFQNRRAKNKRQTEQQVKLQKLVDEAIGTSTGNEQRHLDKSAGDEGRGKTRESPHNLFGQRAFRDGVIATGNEKTTCMSDQATTSSSAVQIPEMKKPEGQCSNDEINTETITSGQFLSEQSEQLCQLKMGQQAGGSQDVAMWPQQATYSSSDPQVVFQSIDQDLLYKVANILSASNDASSLIAEWSQTPNKMQTSNLEEQLQHFADHHQQVLTHNTGTTHTDQKEFTPTSNPPTS